MKIVDLLPDNEPAIRQAAALLVEGFAGHWPEAWPDLESALEEVRESFEAGRISRVALDEDDTVLGWIGGISNYRGRVWELHPLVVSTQHQGKGIGHALVADLEDRVKERGGLTITVGSDDEDYQTTLSDINLFPNVCEHIARVKNLRCKSWYRMVLSTSVSSSFSSLRYDGFSCQEPVMRLKTETLVDANGTTVVFKDIQDNGREMLFEQRRD